MNGYVRVGYARTSAAARKRQNELRRANPIWPLPQCRVADGGCWLCDHKPDKKGYVRVRVLGKTYAAHRLAYEQFRGPIPRGVQLDHHCRTPACFNPWHLRLATNQQNAENRASCGDRETSSRYRGVSFHRKTGKWQATVTRAGTQHYLGLFESEDEAGRVASAFRAEHMPYSVVDRGE